jgi:hypothetical protein
MSEAQFVKKLTPQIRVSSMDQHRMLTPPQAQGRKGTQPPRGGGGQPAKAGSSEVQFRQQPIDVVMNGSSASSSSIKHPGGPAQRPATGQKEPQKVGLGAEDIDLCGTLVDKRIGELLLETSESAVGELVQARKTLSALSRLRAQRR